MNVNQYLAIVNFYSVEKGGRKTTLNNINFRPILIFDNLNFHCQISIGKNEIIKPGDKLVLSISVLDSCIMKQGDIFYLKELNIIAEGQIIKCL